MIAFNPKLFLYDYFRKRLGFRKYFVTDKIRLLDGGSHQKWLRLLFSHPYLYLYYKLNKSLRNPAYPILVGYRIENLPGSLDMEGGGNIPALAVELENNNIIYFIDPGIVSKAQENKDIDLTYVTSRFIFKGKGSRIYVSAKVRIDHGSKITFSGNNNKLFIGANCTFYSRSNINYKGNYNLLIIKNNCDIFSGSKIIFNKNGNLLFLGPNSSLSSICILNFCGNNAVIFICGKSMVNVSFSHIHSNTIFLLGFESTSNSNFRVETLEGKSIIIGSHCMLSHNITIRNGNGHAIYDDNSKKRVSKPQSIIIGDHVWIGQDVIISRGSIGEGAIIGAKSLVNKDIPPHCIAAGIPAKIIRENILWTRQFPKNSDEVKLFESYQDDISTHLDISIAAMNTIDNINIDSPAEEKAKIILEILRNNNSC